MARACGSLTYAMHVVHAVLCPQAAEALFEAAYAHILAAVEHMSEEDKAKEIKAMKPTVRGVAQRSAAPHSANGPLQGCDRDRTSGPL